MNEKWLRWLSIGTAFALMTAACGDDESSTTTAAPTTTGAGATTTAAPSGGELTGTLVFFAYEDSFLPEVLDPFRELHPDLNIETPAFADEDETETKLRAGFQADVVEMCAGEVGDMVTGGLLAPIDTSRIDDWDLILPIFRDALGTTDESGNVYMVPLQGGAAGLIYNETTVPGGIESYDELFFGDWDGTIAVNNEPVNTIGDMLLALGYGPDIFEATDEQVIEAVDKLIEVKDAGRIRAFYDSDTDLFNLLATEEVDAASHGFSSLVGRLAEEGVATKYVAPKEGEVSWNCGHGIAADAENLDAAYALINWYMTPFAQITFAEIEEYLASNQRTLDEGDPDVVEAMGLRAPANMFEGTIYEADPENREFWQDEWRRFQSS
jgi:spermidine/putrescine transport system substrate-binding protein